MTDEKRLFRAIHYNLDNEPEETFSYIYEKYKPLLMFIASRYLKSETDIEDIVHNTFVEFFNNINNIHTTIKSYLSVCCKTNALDYLRAKGKVTYVETEKLSYLSQ
jgi:RNA polymerase sigma factor (sigma-70 family)